MQTSNDKHYSQNHSSYAINKISDHPTIPYIEGDGIGRDIWQAAMPVINAAVAKAYEGTKEIIWTEVYAGKKAFDRFDSWLPDETLSSFKKHLIGIKGPLATPIGGGMRSLNVALRKSLDLYVCQRPVKWFQGLPSPMKHPENVNMVVFRENTEDIYTGIEFPNEEEKTERFKKILAEHFPDDFKKIRFPDSSGFGIKPVSKEGTERLVRAATQWALSNKRHTVTLVHKGNIMKFTEGAFRNWGYDLAEREFGDQVYTYRKWQKTQIQEGNDKANQEQSEATSQGKLFINDVIADIAFEKVLTRTKDFDVLATMNLNGDYLSDALAAQVGGVGIAPGANINYDSGVAIFEATHGTAPDIAGQGIANPCSLILSGEMMLRYMGWLEAADLIINSVEKTISHKTVTFDFHRLMLDSTALNTEEFGNAIIDNM